MLDAGPPDLGGYAMLSKKCDRCEQLIEAPDDKAGAKVTCPKCGDINVMPAATGHTGVDRAAAAGYPASEGPEQEVVFGQQHRPGEAAQTDFTWTTELGVTIAGQLFVHMLCVMVLPYSNWQWATVCLSESMAALRRGVQRTLFQLGRVPSYHQTDNSTAATPGMRSSGRLMRRSSRS